MHRGRFPPIRYAPVFCVLLLPGCTSAGRLHVVGPAAPASRANTILVQVSSDVTDAEKEAIQLEATAAMIAREKLSNQRVLARRNSPESIVDLRIEARIVHLEKVTAEARALNSMLAGRAHLTVDVVVFDVAAKAVVGRFTAEGVSSVAGTTEQAIKRVAEQIVAFVADHFRKTTV